MSDEQPAPNMSDLPETILQFGAGNFLRAFVDLFVSEANAEGQGAGKIVVVQSTPGPRAELLNAQRGRYHVAVRGVSAGELVDDLTEVTSISRALVAATQWNDVLEAGAGEELAWIVSNTTDKGYDLLADDSASDEPPRSFPSRLLHILKRRYDLGRPPLTILPCELHDRNAERLREIVLGRARDLGLDPSFLAWCGEECVWVETLVDRIVAGRPQHHPLLDSDPLLTSAEPYALWVHKECRGARALFEHPAIVRTPDVGPFHLRKLRILNGVHTALVAIAMPRGFETVRAALEDREVDRWIRGLLSEEIIPVIADRVEGAEDYAHRTIERFLNPHLEHRLADIALQHETKLEVRLRPTYREYVEMFGREPVRLRQILGPSAAD